MARLLRGGLAGLVGTMTMTMALRRGSSLLPPRERYPFPPRELVERSVPPPPAIDRKDATLAAHFGFGATCGALIASLRPEPRLVEGALAGLAIWTASYFGWIPAARLLAPANEHPAGRNRLMAGVHLIWGASMAMALNELNRAADTIFASGPVRDAP